MKIAISNPTNRFSDRVNNYIKYRPHYPNDIIELINSKLNLKNKNIAADIGSGTGIFTELLLKSSKLVYAVEPNDEMRLAAEKILGSNKNFISINASAENTTLESSSIDFITCAQSFHWFNPDKTKEEFKRILKDNGNVLLIWNSRINDASDFMTSFEKFLSIHSIDYQKVNHANINKEIFKKFYNEYDVDIFPNYQEFDMEGLKGRVLSASYIPLEEHPKFKPMLNDLENIFNKYENNGIVKMIYKTEVYYGKLS